MRTARRGLGVLVFSVACASPGADEPAARDVDAPRTAEALRTGEAIEARETFGALAVHELDAFLAEVRTDGEGGRAGRPTPSAWALGHPRDLIERSEGEEAFGWPGDLLADGWCMRSTRRMRTPKGLPVLRQLRFYPPPMPDPARLPVVSDDPGRDSEECRLGSFSIAAELDTASHPAIDEWLRAELTRRFGAPSAVPVPPAVAWQRFGTWHDGRVTVAAGVRPGLRRQRLIVAAWIPSAGFDLPQRYALDERLGPPGPEIIRLGGLDETAASGLLEAAREAPPFDSVAKREAWMLEFLDRLETWLEEAAHRNREARAGALLIADRALRASRVARSVVGPDTTPLRQRLHDIGATVSYSPGAGGYDYAGDLLIDAYEGARGTLIGDEAFVRWMRDGMRPGRGCQPARFRRVIDEGEAYLEEAGRRGRRSSMNTVVLAEVHRYLALAYADIVAIDAGNIPLTGYVGSEEELARHGPHDVPAARRRAVKHYQATLDLMPTSAAKRTVWREAWRLAAGLPPVEWTYLCSDE